MANYGFIYTDIVTGAAEETIRAAATSLFGDRLRVRADGSRLFVEAPGTGSSDSKKATRLCLATGEDATMLVEHDPSWSDRPCLAFRGGPQPKWWQWASGCVREEVSDRLGLPIVYDATGEPSGPGDRHYRRGGTFREYMAACFGGTLTAADVHYLRPHFRITPAAFLGAPS